MKSKTSSMVHRFIAGVAPGAMFAARQVIHLGPSKSIYGMLSYMVETGRLERLTYGVYLKPVPFGPTKYPTLEEIAAVKLKAFGRESIIHECDLVKEIDAFEINDCDMEVRGFESSGAADVPLECTHEEQVEELAPDDARCLILANRAQMLDENGKLKGRIELVTNFDLIYDIDSSTSSISTVRGVVKFRRVCKRKMKLGDTKAGRTLRGLWACGQKHLSERRIYKALESLGRSGREELGNISAGGPNWLRDWLECWQFIKPNRKIA